MIVSCIVPPNDQFLTAQRPYFVPCPLFSSIHLPPPPPPPHTHLPPCSTPLTSLVDPPFCMCLMYSVALFKMWARDTFSPTSDGMQSLRPWNESLMWSRRRLSRALWCARLSCDPPCIHTHQGFIGEKGWRGHLSPIGKRTTLE